MPRLKLTDVAKINMGQSPSSETYNTDRNGLPFYQGNVDFGEKYPSARIWCDKPTKIAEPGDILISVRAPIGALNYAKEECCIGRGLAAITPDTNKTSPEFIFWLLRANHANLNRMGTGSTFKAINRKTLEDVTLPGYKKAEQYNIAKILSKIDATIHSKKSQIEQLDELVKARFVEMFGDRFLNTMNWPIKKLGNCATFRNGKAHEKVISETGQYILVTSRAIASDLQDVRHTDSLLTPLAIDDIVMVMSDIPNGKALAKCLLITENEKYTLNQRICSLSNYDLNPIFFTYLLNRHQYFLSFNDGNGQTNLRKDDILKCPLIVPPIELQNQFAAFVAQVDKSKFALSDELTVCDFYVCLIYDRVMHGRIDLRVS